MAAEETKEEEAVETAATTKNDTAKKEEPKDNEKNNQNSVLQAATSKALRPFVIISSSYLLFTITDGAIRMIVLMHAYNKAFSALEVAVMFTLYELAGVFTNLLAGFMGAKWGIKFTLVIGLSLQIFSYGLLFGWRDDWTKQEAIVYVTIAQMFAGIAKDLTKLGGKTVTKLVTPEERETQLFKLVSLITGWKNSLKGVGYFLGSALIGISYELALSVMMALVVLAMPWAILGLDKNLGTAKKKNASLWEVFNMNNHNLNYLSLARLFLFASRDFWFEVPLPFYLRSPACGGLGEQTCFYDTNATDTALMEEEYCPSGSICNEELLVCENLNVGGGCGGLGANRVVVGALLGGYIILYGQIQSWTPQLVTGPLNQTPPNKFTEILWGMINCLPTLVMGIVIVSSEAFTIEGHDVQAQTAWLVIVIVCFAAIFAINSSIHSFLVVNYASMDKVAVSVGFYYMSNAMGRLFGTIGSGILYTYVGDYLGPLAGNDATAGFAACFFAGTASSFLAALITLKINDDDAGLNCGSCVIVHPKQNPEDDKDVAGFEADKTDINMSMSNKYRTIQDIEMAENNTGAISTVSKMISDEEIQQKSSRVPISSLSFSNKDGQDCTDEIIEQLQQNCPQVLDMVVSATNTTTTVVQTTTTTITSLRDRTKEAEEEQQEKVQEQEIKPPLQEEQDQDLLLGKTESTITTATTSTTSPGEPQPMLSSPLPQENDQEEQGDHSNDNERRPPERMPSF